MTSQFINKTSQMVGRINIYLTIDMASSYVQILLGLVKVQSNGRNQIGFNLTSFQEEYLLQWAEEKASLKCKTCALFMS